MHWVFALARFAPYWVLPIVLVLWETGVYFKRRNKRKSQWICWLSGGALVILIGLWFYFRGDLYSDEWVRLVFGITK
jgi:hypothetical protein